MTLRSDIMDKVCLPTIKIIMMDYFTALLIVGCPHKKIKIQQTIFIFILFLRRNLGNEVLLARKITSYLQSAIYKVI